MRITSVEIHISSNTFGSKCLAVSPTSSSAVGALLLIHGWYALNLWELVRRTFNILQCFSLWPVLQWPHATLRGVRTAMKSQPTHGQNCRFIIEVHSEAWASSQHNLGDVWRAYYHFDYGDGHLTSEFGRLHIANTQKFRLAPSLSLYTSQLGSR